MIELYGQAAVIFGLPVVLALFVLYRISRANSRMMTCDSCGGQRAEETNWIAVGAHVVGKLVGGAAGDLAGGVAGDLAGRLAGTGAGQAVTNAARAAQEAEIAGETSYLRCEACGAPARDLRYGLVFVVLGCIALPGALAFVLYFFVAG